MKNIDIRGSVTSIVIIQLIIHCVLCSLQEFQNIADSYENASLNRPQRCV